MLKGHQMTGTTNFRSDLRRIMPGYKWTVHKSRNPNIIRATGIMSSGFNRLSTLEVTREVEPNGSTVYAVCSAGHGTKAHFGPVFRERTIARALRDLQDHYERNANTFRVLAGRLNEGRKPIQTHDDTPGVK